MRKSASSLLPRYPTPSSSVSPKSLQGPTGSRVETNTPSQKMWCQSQLLLQQVPVGNKTTYGEIVYQKSYRKTMPRISTLNDSFFITEWRLTISVRKELCSNAKKLSDPILVGDYAQALERPCSRM